MESFLLATFSKPFDCTPGLIPLLEQSRAEGDGEIFWTPSAWQGDAQHPMVIAGLWKCVLCAFAAELQECGTIAQGNNATSQHRIGNILIGRPMSSVTCNTAPIE